MRNSDWRAIRLEALWEEYRACVIVRWRVRTPEINAELERARAAFLAAIEREHLDSS